MVFSATVVALQGEMVTQGFMAAADAPRRFFVYPEADGAVPVLQDRSRLARRRVRRDGIASWSPCASTSVSRRAPCWNWVPRSSRAPAS